MIPLTVAPAGEKMTIMRLGGNHELQSHLEDMGFVAGGLVTVISAIEGNLILNVKGTRVAVGKELASHIMVQ